MKIDFDEALKYSRKHGAQALLTLRSDEVAGEAYDGDWQADRPHPLFSGTKSFWGPVAIVAQAEGLLDLDEPVARTFPQWRGDAYKSRVTLRELLNLTSGFGFGGLGSSVPPYSKALSLDIKNEPGTTFTYGGIPLQVFGAVLAQKLAPRGLSPHDYLREQLLEPAGVAIASWRTLADGAHPLPTGAMLTARAWSRYGAFVARDDRFVPCFAGSSANARYGLGWWLDPTGHVPDLAYASGAGGQAMYVFRSSATVVVRFGNGRSFKHEAFLRALTGIAASKTRARKS